MVGKISQFWRTNQGKEEILKKKLEEEVKHIRYHKTELHIKEKKLDKQWIKKKNGEGKPAHSKVWNYSEG